MSDIEREREEEIDRLRKINAGKIEDTRADFDYKPGTEGCGCSTCEKRRRLGIGLYGSKLNYGAKVQGRLQR